LFRYILNKLFKEKFGWKVRDGISTTPQIEQAEGYGPPYIFLPANGYEFAWSKRHGDLWLDIRANLPVGTLKNKRKQSAFKRAVNSYIDTDLVNAIKLGKSKAFAEVMFKTEKYYLLEYSQKVEKDLRLALGMSTT